MIDNYILYGKYYFPVSASFQSDLIFLSVQGQTTFFLSNGVEFTQIASVDDGGVTKLKYITRDGVETIVWDENQEWVSDEYRFIEFLQPTDIGEQYFTRVEYLLTPYETIIDGHYKWNLPLSASDDYELYLTNSNYYISNNVMFTTMRYNHISGDLYYDDMLVYNSIADEWYEGEEYRRIDFSNTSISTPFYNFIIAKCSKMYEVTYIAPQLEGYQAMVDFQIVTNLKVFSNDVPLTRNAYYNFNDVTYYVYSYYYDSSFTSEITSTDIALTNDMNVYIRLDEAEWIPQRKYVISSDIHNENIEYINMNFKCKGSNTTYDGFRSSSSKIEYRDLSTQNWVTACNIFFGQGVWVDTNYQYIEIIESMLANILHNAIVDNNGFIAFNIEYTSNVQGQTIATKYWHNASITSGDLPSITPPQYYSFDGWYYDPLFIKKAQNGDTISSDVHLYGKIYLPSAIDIYLYENIDVNNSLRKTPTQKAIVSGTFKQPTSIVHPIVLFEYDKLDFNYCFIPSFNRYYYVDDIIVINNKLIEIHCSCDVLMSFKNQLLDTYAIVSRNEDDFNAYLTDPRDTLEDGCDVQIVEATGGENISSSDMQENGVNILLMGVK